MWSPECHWDLSQSCDCQAELPSLLIYEKRQHLSRAGCLNILSSEPVEAIFYTYSLLKNMPETGLQPYKVQTAKKLFSFSVKCKKQPWLPSSQLGLVQTGAANDTNAAH